jgi:FAD/FMN-containing dehydrogenase
VNDASTTTRTNALRREVAGEVTLPGSPAYDTVRKSAMSRFDDVRPAAVVRCRRPADVSATIRFGRSSGMQLAIRCGGHSVAGRSSGEGIVIDVTPMHEVAVGDGIATVGAGARLGDLYEALYEHGVTIPAGCGPTVGIAGLALGGGIGVLGRRYGLTCDQLLRAQVVLADSSVVACDEREEPDLFWALRGAGGGNFGVVTSLVFTTVSAPETTVFRLCWPFTSAAELVESWQAWAPAASDDVDATLRLTAGPSPASTQVELIGAVLGGETEAARHLDAFLSRVRASPDARWFRRLPYPAAKRRLNEIDQGSDHSTENDPRGHIYSKSEFFRRELDGDTIEALVQNFSRDAARSRAREVAFMPWGGAYNGVAPDATAFPHRKELFLAQYLLETDPESHPSDLRGSLEWLERSWELLRPLGSGGVYPNFPDPDLPDPGHAYYAGNLNRLLRVKATYDPDNLFSAAWA